MLGLFIAYGHVDKAAAAMPTDMLPAGTYALVMNGGLDSGASLNVSIGAFYYQTLTFPPDTIQSALYSDSTYPNQVDIESMTIDTIPFYPGPISPVVFRPATVNGVATPGNSSFELYTNPSDPYGSGVIRVTGSTFTYPPIVDDSSGTATLVQESAETLTIHTADGTLNGTGPNLNGTIQELHYQVVGDPSRTFDAYSGYLQGSDLTPSGERQFGGVLQLGVLGSGISA